MLARRNGPRSRLRAICMGMREDGQQQEIPCGFLYLISHRLSQQFVHQSSLVGLLQGYVEAHKRPSIPLRDREYPSDIQVGDIVCACPDIVIIEIFRYSESTCPWFIRTIYALAADGCTLRMFDLEEGEQILYGRTYEEKCVMNDQLRALLKAQ